MKYYNQVFLMYKNFFEKLRILDGGMGQELHARGLISKGTLWSTSAILDEKYHNIVVDTHMAYINAGAEVIITNNSENITNNFENIVYSDKSSDLLTNEFLNNEYCRDFDNAIKESIEFQKKYMVFGGL